MRLFSALYPPDDVIAAIDAAVGERAGGLRWVPPHQRHVTLAFYGDVADDVVPDLGARLERVAAKSSAFSLRVSGAATFPRQAARARVVHAGLAGDVEQLTRLADRCSAAARRVNIPVDDRKFRPHLTLGRARLGSFDAREIVSRLSSYESAEWTVTSFRLVHSTLSASVTHTPLQEFALTKT